MAQGVLFTSWTSIIQYPCIVLNRAASINFNTFSDIAAGDYMISAYVINFSIKESTFQQPPPVVPVCSPVSLTV